MSIIYVELSKKRQAVTASVKRNQLSLATLLSQSKHSIVIPTTTGHGPWSMANIGPLSPRHAL